jgi:hypothetical protein
LIVSRVAKLLPRGCAKRTAVLPGQADASGIKNHDDERHQPSCTAADFSFHHPHCLTANRLTNGFKNKNLEEHGADKHDGGKQM